MRFTREELLHMEAEAAATEVYLSLNQHKLYGSDNIVLTEYFDVSVLTDEQIAHIKDARLMDEEDYNRYIVNNTCLRFSDYYEDGDKVLIILLIDKEE